MKRADPPGTRYVIRLSDGSFYVRTIAKGNLISTKEISEAHQYPTRFLALQEIAHMDDAKSFAHAAILSWDPPERAV